MAWIHRYSARYHYSSLLPPPISYGYRWAWHLQFVPGFFGWPWLYVGALAFGALCSVGENNWHCRLCNRCRLLSATKRECNGVCQMIGNASQTPSTVHRRHTLIMCDIFSRRSLFSASICAHFSSMMAFFLALFLRWDAARGHSLSMLHFMSRSF